VFGQLKRGILDERGRLSTVDILSKLAQFAYRVKKSFVNAKQ